MPLKPVFLKILKDGKVLKMKPFTQDQISIGSGEGLNLKLDGLSPWHVLIEKKLDRYVILDLESETGTKVDGTLIEGEVFIESGSVIKIGEYSIHFFIGPPPVEPVKKPVPKPIEKLVAKPVPKSPVKKPGGLKKTPSPEPLKASVKDSSVKKSMSQSMSGIGKKIGLKKEKLQSSLKRPSTPSKDSPSQSQRASSLIEKKKFVPKPQGVGFWNTYAPSNQIRNLDHYIKPSSGNLVEVIVAWQDRILSTHCFSKPGSFFIGSSKECDVFLPSAIMPNAYPLMEISKSGVNVSIKGSVTGVLIEGDKKESRVSTEIQSPQNLKLNPYEMIRLNMDSSIRVYIRLTGKPKKPLFGNLLNFQASEVGVLLFSTILTALLIFYAGIYAQVFLLKDPEFIEEKIRVAFVKFDQPIPLKDYTPSIITKKKNVVDVKKTKTKSLVIKQTPKKRPTPKKKVVSRPKISPKATKPKTQTTSKPKVGMAPGKVSKKSPPKSGSARPGGSLKASPKAKPSTGPKTVEPDPTQVGLLGVLGGGGKMNNLDKKATGPVGASGLANLAETATGQGGTAESYEGEGIGTRTKDLGSGGQGSALVGISGIKTKNRGGSLDTGTGSGLGKRGELNIDVGVDGIEAEGEIDRAAILRVIRQNKIRFDRCYQFILQQQPSVQGSIKLQWTILPDGRVRSASALEDLVGHTGLTTCVSNVIKSLRFPKPPSGQIPRVSYKFVFSI